jgi:hypothetical protein
MYIGRTLGIGFFCLWTLSLFSAEPVAPFPLGIGQPAWEESPEKRKAALAERAASKGQCGGKTRKVSPEESACRLAPYPVRCSFAMQNGRASQDRIIKIEDISIHFESLAKREVVSVLAEKYRGLARKAQGYAFYAVLDGHGGCDTVDYIKRHFVYEVSEARRFSF